MNEIFPFANQVTGVLILLVGFGFHFVGQLISVVSWERATKWGCRKRRCRP
ncbi:MAG: hypothetical protein NTY53_26190 [Kiritimatiellaeota bacterium]|nr:hypothetical protein [Kiritimatiellota bacterium]